MIKELAKELEGQFEVKTEKYITFSVQIKKELDNGKTITCKLKFVDSFRFMLSSLSSLIDNQSEGFQNDKRADYQSCLGYMLTKDSQLIFKCTKYSKNHEKHFNKDLIKRFVNTYEFYDGDINIFCY